MGPNCTDVHFLGPWVWDQMGCSIWVHEGKTAIGRVEGGDIKWAVVYDHYESGGSIQIHTAISDPKYVSRQAILAIFEYPFLELGVKKLLATVNSENAAALSLDLRLGFQIETVIKDAYEMGDMYILSMTLDQCHWLRGIRDGKQQQAA